VDFINHKTLFPSREEYHDYLRWCGDGVDHMVHYGLEVDVVRPGIEEDGRVVEVDVTAIGADGGNGGLPGAQPGHGHRACAPASGGCHLR
jgi:hypothetical protein